jgi:uracil-DNA glycosylase
LALGASATFALTGIAEHLASRRGKTETDLHDGSVLVSWHPAYILRLRDPALQARARSELIEDLRADSAATPNLPSEPT